MTTFTNNTVGESVSVVAGIGSLSLTPSGTTNGAPLAASPPSGYIGCRFYLSGSDSVTFTIANAQPTGAPSVTFTISAATTGPNWDENLSKGQMIYITASAGTPKFRWF